MSDFDIDQVNSALMLCLIKERALRQIEEHYYYEFLSELIDGTLETTGKSRHGQAVCAGTFMMHTSLSSRHPIPPCGWITTGSHGP